MKLNKWFWSLMLVLNLQYSLSQEKNIAEENIIKSTVSWNFNDLRGWVDGSQNITSKSGYSIKNGILKIYTKANTWERPKIKTKKQAYKQGKYTWRVFVPKMGIGDKASIGAFVYSDDKHELDFEIGYGSSKVRDELNASKDELIVYMTSQANPFHSVYKTIKRNRWYSLILDIKEVKGKYSVVWYINGEEKTRLNLDYGNTSFYIFCSVENLEFIGDHIPTKDNYGLFDYVKYEAY